MNALELQKLTDNDAILKRLQDIYKQNDLSFSKEEILVLKNLSSGSDIGVRFWAKRVIGRFCPGNVPENAPESSDHSDGQEQTSLTVLINKLNDVGSTYVSMEIIQKLCQTKSEQACEALFSYLSRCKDPVQLSFLTKNLGISFPCESTEYKLLPFLKHQDDRVVANTIEGLEAIGQPRHVAIFAQLLKHKNNRVRANAAQAISRYDRKQGLDVLIKMLQMKDRLYYVVSACHAAEQLKDDSLVSFLEPLLKDDLTILDALQALKSIGGEKVLKIVRNALNAASDDDQAMLLKEFLTEMEKEFPQQGNSLKTSDQPPEVEKSTEKGQPGKQNDEKPVKADRVEHSSTANSNMTVCTRCGKNLNSGSKICTKCGFIQKSSSSQKGAVSTEVAAKEKEKTEVSKCSKCGTRLSAGATFCSGCGARSGVAENTGGAGRNKLGTRDEDCGNDFIYPRNPPLPPNLAWISIVVPGLPQIIFGQVAKGITIFFILLLTVTTDMFFLVAYVASFIDAFLLGTKLKAGHSVKKWEFFPK